MPEQIKVSDYIRETWDDYNSPTTSNFINRMGHCRNTVAVMEETLDSDRSGLNKLKKTVKALYNTGSTHVINEAYLAENLEKLGSHSLQKEQESDIGSAFLKFAVVTKELSVLMKNLMQNLNNVLMFPLDSFLKGDLRGVKGDLKKPFDKTWKEYEAKFSKIEKEKKQLAKEAGMVKTEVTGAEIAEELEKERGMFQLQTTEYLIKVNDIKTKKGVDLLQHLVEYYYAQMNYFTDGLKTIQHFKSYIEDLVSQLGKVKQKQDAERRELIELRDVLKTSMASYNRESVSTGVQYSLHQLQGNKAHGYERTGYLLKKSEGKMRKVWQKRKCIVKDGFLCINHADTSKPPVKLNLLTCQVKLIYDDPGKKCFDLISSSKNRTYHFQAEDTQEMEAWISVLNNAKESVLMKAFGECNDKESSPMNQSVKELTRTILEEVKRLPGNRCCCDCGAPDPEWLSVNLGVLICLECCGVHREMGVHISRTQSIVIDDLGTSQLLLARVVSNRGFNEIMEATLDTQYKPTIHSPMEERKTFIRSKYERHRYAIMTCTNIEDRRQDLKQAVVCKDLLALIQVYAEGIDFTEALPDMPKNQSALHLAIEEEDNRSLYMVDFMVQNSNAQFLTRSDRDGNTVLHYCAAMDRTECMKLLLRVCPDLCSCENRAKETPLAVAQGSGNELCVELISHSMSGKTEMFSNVNIDWGLVSDDRSYDDVDYSDDDLDKALTPDRKQRSRPGSLVMTSEQSLGPFPPGVTGGGRDFAGPRDRCSSMVADSLRGKTGLILPSGLSGSTQSLVTNTLQRKKPPAPPPPTYKELQRHSRKHSDPGFGMTHALSQAAGDPPPLPEKQSRQTAGGGGGGGGGSPNSKTPIPGGQMRRKSYAGMTFPSALLNLYHKRTGSYEPFCYTIGARLVLPPPPEFRSNDVTASEPFHAALHQQKSAPRAASSHPGPTDEYVALQSVSRGTKHPPHGTTSTETKSILRSTPQHQTESLTNSLPQNIHHMTTHPGGHHGNYSSNGNVTVITRHKNDSGGGGYPHHAMDARNSNVMTQSAKFSHNGGGAGGGVMSASVYDRRGEERGRGIGRDRGGSTDSQGSSSSREGVLEVNAPPFRLYARCRALYDCEADHEDELSFREGEVILVLKEEEEEWWEGVIEGQPNRRGMFPATFVAMIT